MPRQSHAVKAVKLFTDLVSELETKFMGFADMIHIDHLMAGLCSAGAQLYGLAGAAAAGVQAAVEQAEAQLAASLLLGDAPGLPDMTIAVLDAQYGGELLGWGRDDWMKQLCDDYVQPEACALTGVHPGEVVAQEYS
jgi:hypothetical protein